MKQEIRERIEKIRKGEVPEGYRKTKVGIIPDRWEMKNLGDAAEVVMGQSPVGTSYNHSGTGAPLINGPTEFTEKYPIKIQWTSQPTKFCKKGDVLLCVRGSSTGRMNISDDEYCIGRGVAAIRAKSGVDKLFITFQVESAIKSILALTTGSTFPNIDGKSIKTIQFPLPPLSEQQKIAEILSTWDKAIELKEKLITEKKEFKRGLMQKLLTGEMRFPGFTDEWKNIKLKNLVSKMQSGGTPKTSEVKYYNGIIPFVKVNDITVAGKYLRKTTMNINEEGLKNSSSWLVPVNSILYSMYASVGVLCINKIPVATSQAIINILPNNNVDLEYLYYFLLNHKTKISRLIETGTQGNVNAGIVRDIQVNLPSFEEQKKISLTLSNQDRKIELLEKEVFQLKNEKKGLMQLLLTGIVRVNI